MFIRNTTSSDVDFPSWEGYALVIPPGVSAICNEAGKYLIGHYAFETSLPMLPDGKPNGAAIPVIILASREEWNGQYVRVSRFQINGNLIPRQQLIEIAEKRGVSQDRLDEYRNDTSIEVTEIANDINRLPVPEDIRFPEKLMPEKETVDA